MFGRLFNSRGQAVVEFAIILPLFLLLVFGMMQFGLIFHDYLVVNEAAREGARAAAVGSNNTTISDKIHSAATTLDKSKLIITVVPLTKRLVGETVTVTVSIPVLLKLPYVSQLAPANLEGQVVMRVEKDSP